MSTRPQSFTVEDDRLTYLLFLAHINCERVINTSFLLDQQPSFLNCLCILVYSHHLSSFMGK